MKSKPKIRFELFTGYARKKGQSGWIDQWYFRIVSARNGQTLCVSEGYTRKQSARDTIRSIAHGLNPKLKWADYKPTEQK